MFALKYADMMNGPITKQLFQICVLLLDYSLILTCFHS
jgi:hypothetical protein